MAETKGTDNKPGDGKPGDIKSGPVKPPVLDLKARETTNEPQKPDVKTADGKPEIKPAPKPDFKPAARSASAPRDVAAKRGGFGFGAAITGGVIGLAAAYGLASLGYWPTTVAQPAPVADPRLAQFATAIPELETVTQTTQSELATLNQRVATLENAEPEPAAATPTPAAASTPPVDVSGIKADIAALGERLDTLSAEPAPVLDTSAIEGDLASLTARIDELGARVGTTESELRTLDTTVAQTSAAVASQPSDIGAVLQLPLILSGFETAFATGRPFETELAALRAAVPEAAIPTSIANNAGTGLTRPDTIAQRFAAVLPAMLAGRPVNPDAQWQDGALDWFRSAIALRPTGETDGDTPEAIMSRLEGAIARRDFASAETLIAALPQPMQAAAEDVPAMVSAQAEAAGFLETLRAQALNGEASQ